MGRRFNKKTAQTFSVVHRAHDDALFYDNEALEHVLVPLEGGNQRTRSKILSTKKVFNTSQLALALSEHDVKKIRANEGLAAQYGIYFDDSQYDYMQHLRPTGDAEAVVIEAKPAKASSGRRERGDIGALFGDQLPSEAKRHVAYDEGQNVPNELAGFNPDMDPRLREVLEALEDEEYLERRKDEDAHDIEGYEDDDDALFADLLGSGEVAPEEFYYGSDAEYQDGDEWDLDNYKDEFDARYGSDASFDEAYNAGEAPEGAEAPVAVRTGWERDFDKFRAAKKGANEWDSDDEFEEDDEVGELPTVATKAKSRGKLRRKKGAMSDTSEFSMSSLANFRTEGLTLLDDKYEQLAKKFEEEPEEEYQEFDMALERQDLEGMLDDFLENYETEKGGRRLVKKSETRHKIQEAADLVSRGKVAAKRQREVADAMAKMRI